MATPPPAVAFVNEAGRFTQTVAQEQAQYRARRRLCTAMTVTEVDRDTRARLLTLDGWDGAYGDKGGRDDCGGTWDPTVWAKVWAASVVVSDRTYVDERGQRTGKTVPFYMALEHKATSRRWLFGELHTPHQIREELRTGHVHTEAGHTYVEVTTGYRHEADQIADQRSCDVVALSADWNIDLREEWAYRWLAEWGAHSDLAMTWHHGHLPADGTHGRELIDATLIRGARQVGQPELLANARGDDHTGYLLHAA